ncbi:glycosyltransferase family 2 protein [Mangrovibacterium marinum]|uniref:GT2 family glycosyltransferase n=1 Tax=Mangrovibacterium marinum TaxID=1639118 RepID=A0A2T5BZW9_9BACT|nr:glycosyltransferase family 2 protein [Mangrovibacterium marinum]PTN07844.1 GT2 family glycosyltransferase [Mangrovibacterium marinum]
MKLSVIIVNYNVKTLLEQCLLSVERAMQAIEGEIIVVDNASADESCTMIQEKFPQVRLLANKLNEGFSKANNRALRIARGEYLLLLNPDTLVPEDCFDRCIDFMDRHPDAGALGVRMIDGGGHYLPESKRGLPTPWVAFCKIFGLTRLFPGSRRFAGYYLGHLPNDKTCPIDVLAGAFMFMRRRAIDQAGLLDESFFMYGEDIDLSFRIGQCGFQNYYFPETNILHYKGESTRRGSLNYVVLFYKAMLIFANKHFSGQHNGLFKILIKLAVYFRALLSVLSRIAGVMVSPLQRLRPPFGTGSPKRALLIAARERFGACQKMLNNSPTRYQPLELMAPEKLEQTARAVEAFAPDVLIFDLNSVSATLIIQTMDRLCRSNIHFKIVGL